MPKQIILYEMERVPVHGMSRHLDVVVANLLVQKAVKAANELGMRGAHIISSQVETEDRDYSFMRGIRVVVEYVEP